MLPLIKMAERVVWEGIVRWWRSVVGDMLYDFESWRLVGEFWELSAKLLGESDEVSERDMALRSASRVRAKFPGSLPILGFAGSRLLVAF